MIILREDLWFVCNSIRTECSLRRPLREQFISNVQLMKSILSDSAKNLSSEVECLSLLINLACDQTTASTLGEAGDIRILLKLAFATRNPLLMKLLRNLSQFEELRIQFVVS